MNPRTRKAVAWLALGAWLVWRGVTGTPQQLPSGASLTYFYWDATWLPLVLSLLVFGGAAELLSPRAGWLATLLVAGVTTCQLYLLAAERYYAGLARAWDLANYVQPMWRAAHGMSMSSAAYDGRPIWGDHGSIAMFAFAPATRLTDHAATGLFLVQSVVIGGAVLTMFGLSRALRLPPWVALGTACVLASSRALAQAARFDFHPECAFPAALLGLAWAHAEGRRWAVWVLTLVASSLRDVAALSAGTLWLYWAVRHRSWRALLPAALAGTLALFDMVVLPRWTGWQSYVALHGSSPLDPLLVLQTTGLRALSTFVLGWLHPVAWVAGAPWITAAAMSPKLLVKGIDFQYGFLFVPVAALGAAYALRWLAARDARSLTIATSLWVALAVSVNAPLPVSIGLTRRSQESLRGLERELAKLVPPAASVTADACAAPYLVERADLTLLCRLDVQRMEQTGVESWEDPVPTAFSATHLVLRADCEVNGPCARAQVDRAQTALGFLPIGRAGPFVVLRRESPHASQ